MAVISRSLSTFTAAFMALAVVLSACSYRGESTYKPGEAGTVMKVERGIVTNARSVTIEGLKKDQAVGWGTVVGAGVAGAATYGLTGADTPLGVAVTIIAAIGGALVGTRVEELKNRHPGAEYIIKRDDGSTFGVVQALPNKESVLPKGRRVTVLYGRDGFVRVAPEN
jgi:outer membrane lipoprotein SlyB